MIKRNVIKAINIQEIKVADVKQEIKHKATTENEKECSDGCCKCSKNKDK